jgi:hypothetical protein
MHAFCLFHACFFFYKKLKTKKGSIYSDDAAYECIIYVDANDTYGNCSDSWSNELESTFDESTNETTSISVEVCSFEAAIDYCRYSCSESCTFSLESDISWEIVSTSYVLTTVDSANKNITIEGNSHTIYHAGSNNVFDITVGDNSLFYIQNVRIVASSTLSSQSTFIHFEAADYISTYVYFYNCYFANALTSANNGAVLYMYFGTNMTANVNNTVFAYSMHA